MFYLRFCRLIKKRSADLQRVNDELMKLEIEAAYKVTASVVVTDWSIVA
jgi:hypothetical protein